MMRYVAATALLVGSFAGTTCFGEEGWPDVSPEIEREVNRLLDAYMAAWNRRDLAGWEGTFHFPHYRLAGGTMKVLDRPGLQDAAKVWAAAGRDWHHSGWDRRRIVHASGEKVHVDTKFTRYRADGGKLGSFDSLYILTKENGRWGVKMRSSFAR
jgi:hypothetical protein